MRISRISQCKSLIIRLNSVDPILNLAFENWLFENGPKDQTCLLLWRDEPCVVMGRNQNPWIECNVQAINDANIPLIRRYSGGGAVYHDLGNSIYSVMMPKEKFSRNYYAGLWTKALMDNFPQLDLSVGERHDIFDRQQHKISGSAFRISRGRAYHHGTMLLRSDISNLTKFLSSPIQEKMLCKGTSISSVKSLVKNLEILDHEQLCKLLSEQFSKHQETTTDEIILDTNDLESIEQVQMFKNELQSDEWTFGKTLPFAIKVPTIGNINIENGIITQSDDPSYLNVKFSASILKELFSLGTKDQVGLSN